MGKNLPRVLVISNNSLSDSNNNGRTLSMFLSNWDKGDLAQIYISGEVPSSNVCDNFYRMRDKDVLKGLFNRSREVGGVIKNSNDKNSVIKVQKIKKNVLKLIVRDLLWNSNVWWTDKLRYWIESFDPQLILYFAGESKFTYRIASRIKKEYDLPVVMYNSEAYYLNDTNYLTRSLIYDLIYKSYHKGFCREFEKLMKNTEAVIYINDRLKEDSDKYFSVPSYVIYTASGLEYKKKTKTNEHIRISYLGNLSFGRDISLAEIAQALQCINKKYKLDVYGNIRSDNVKKTFDACDGINYCGVVSYEKVIEIMYNSDILVHCESFDDNIRRVIKYGFSTKIADSLSCGTCFMIYAPNELACTEYLKDNDCAIVVTERAMLEEEIRRVIDSPYLRDEYAKKARRIAEANHNREVSCRKFEEIIVRAAENYEGSADKLRV